MSRRTPLVVIVEDAHWADPPTLLLLRHLARGAPDAHGLVLTTFRDTEAEIPETLSSALADLRRTEGVVRVRLAGLSAEEIAEFVDLAGDRDPRAEQGEVARSLRELTGGNAFLMTELWRTLVDSEARWEGGWPDGTLADLRSPEGVREVVGQRLARLDTATIDVLELAAVAGHEFDLSIVGRAGPALEQAVAHGMIEEVPSRQLAFQFTHELVRRALYDRMPGLRRAELHLRVGEALERDAGDRPRVADLAYHFAAAAPIDGPERAVEYALLAGREAIATLAYDEAEARFAAALSLGMTDPRRVAETQLELGTACSRGGRSERAIAAYRAAADLARDLDDAELLATAAVGFEEACWRPAIVDQGAIELLWEASAALPEDDSTLRVKVLAGLARALDFVGRLGGQLTRARGRASRWRGAWTTGRDSPRSSCASYWSRDVREFAQTLDMLAEARDLAHGVGDDELEIDAREWRVAGLIALGDLGRAHEEHDEVLAIAAPAAPAVPDARRRALRLDARAVRRAPRGCGGVGAPVPRVGAPVDRPPALGHPRHPDVQHPPRAGPPRRAVRRHAPARRRRRPGRRLAPRSGRAPRGARPRGRDAARARRHPARGLRRAARLALAGLAHLPGRRMRRRGGRRARRAAVPGARAARGRERRDRPRRRLLRRGRPVPRAARRDAGRARSRRRPLRGGADAQPADARPDVGRQHAPRLRPHAARAAGAAPTSEPRPRCCRTP